MTEQILSIVCFVVSIWPVVILLGACIGIGVGFVLALKCYIESIYDNIDPYEYYEDSSTHKQEHAKRRSYFFGPGYRQLLYIAEDAWDNLWFSANDLDDIRDKIIDFIEMNFVVVILEICWTVCWAFYLCAIASLRIFGIITICVFGLVHTVALTGAMTVIYVLFSATWVVDRVYLQSKSIKSSCPIDQTRAVIPMFECSKCGSIHDRLVPGPYGIWWRRCTCGKALPTTFLLGRSKLKAICPTCGSELAASDVQQFSLSLVGGTSSGKTVLLAAFYHELLAVINESMLVCYEIPQMHREMFDNLNDWYNGVPCPATRVSQTSDMYSIILKSNRFKVSKQFSLYDIAGEAFEDSAMASMIPQKQMRDSDGVIITIDPLSAMTMRESARDEGDDTQKYSTADAATIVNNFVTYLKAVLTNSKIKNKSQKPVSVVITKADLSSISRRISYHKIKTIMNQQPDTFGSFDEARDTICREFLIDIGLIEAVQAIEAGFAEVHYFPVSAIGHVENGEEYEPEHVTEPFYWLIDRAQPELMRTMGLCK